MSQLTVPTPQVINYWIRNFRTQSETTQLFLEQTCSRVCWYQHSKYQMSQLSFPFMEGWEECLALFQPELCLTNYLPNYAAVYSDNVLRDIRTVLASVPSVFDTFPLSKQLFCDVKSIIFARIIACLLCKLITFVRGTDTCWHVRVDEICYWFDQRLPVQFLLYNRRLTN